MTTETTRAQSRRWGALGVLVLPVLFASMDISILYMAIPAVTADLTPSADQLLWILDAYGFLLAGLLVTAGNLGDRIGRRRLLMVGAAVFGAASLMAALSPTPEALIAARALMGVGGATLMPSTLSLIRNLFTDRVERTRAIGLWTAAFAGGSALGPILGGFLLEFLPWGSVFMVNVPVVVLLLAVTPLLVPEYRHGASGPLDPVSVVLSFAAVLPLVWAIKTTAEEVAVTVPTAMAAAAGVLMGAVFLRRQRRLATPLVDVSLFRDRGFTGAVLAGGTMMFALVGMMYHVNQYLQLVLGYSPLTAALWQLPLLVAVGAASTSAASLARLIGNAALFCAGAVSATAGMLLLALTPVDQGLWWVLAGATLVGLGVGPVAALAVDVVVASVGPERSGAASAVSETVNEFGAALGVAVLGSVGAMVYGEGVRDDLPGEVPSEVAEAVSANLGAAARTAERLPEEARVHLLA
ncbi:MFS transporter, partial [Nocardiopsis halotolerans]|uniref:MFS transporter n=1 Tax=Nocardiopsis halotolerans TaxID=124252 RepID=UPI00036FF867